MVFDKDFFDLGRVKKGEKRTLQFRFSNKGDEALEIDFISACDCTTLDYPVLPVKPGSHGVIDAIFDSTNESGEKVVDITIVLKHTNPRNGYPVVEEVKYKTFVYE